MVEMNEITAAEIFASAVCQPRISSDHFLKCDTTVTEPHHHSEYVHLTVDLIDLDKTANESSNTHIHPGVVVKCVV
jgi:hypothetical protein